MKSRTPSKTSSSAGRRVYSSDVGRTCPGCLRAQQQCICKAVHNTLVADAGDGIVRLHRETKGRKGKGVTVIKKGLALAESDLATLAKTLKSRCGVGGSVNAGIIELQTADREKIKSLLEAQGYTVKIAGG